MVVDISNVLLGIDGNYHCHLPPVAGPFPGPGKLRPPYDEWSLGGEEIKKSMICGVQDLMPVEVMDIVFKYPAVMGAVGTDSLNS